MSLLPSTLQLSSLAFRTAGSARIAFAKNVEIKIMPRYRCPKCGANNSEAGRCVACFAPIGSVRVAVRAAMISTLALIGAWAIFSGVTRIQAPIFAIGFGAAVAACTTYYSGGRGITYQLIATGFTIVGMIVGDSLAVILFSLIYGNTTLSDLTLAFLWSQIVYRAIHDSYTTVFYLFGILGSLFIWKS